MDIRIKTLSNGISEQGYLAQLELLLEKSHANNASPHVYKQDRTFFKSNLEGGAYNIVALSGERVVGYTALRKMQPWPEYLERTEHAPESCALMLYSLVDPEARGCGIGALLAQKRIELAQCMGLQHLYATVHPSNHANMKILTRLGFNEIAVKPLFKEQLLRSLMYLKI
ncbi:GNAT family N-acetyltransferase [Alteromonas sp. a30]|uniref:GNAT family N-acetyltransferase n=1 Tax=Alteromonas sp. a30 TaxID=2730917 RepID=UPI00227E88F3|nr:GNAT family N-acetyltransferase [Alteromonas sp. a30]MCY7296446.1 GNAT family N-acetyltransferase [Alteromonas sp. a30]